MTNDYISVTVMSYRTI